MRGVFLGCLLVLLGCRSEPVVLENPPRDVVLLVLCTARADQFKLWGAPVDTTPYLTAKLNQGVWFSNTISQAPWTRPASVAILTGQYPAEVGMVEPGAGRNDRILGEEVLTIGERLHASGFQTIGLTANPNLNAHFGFQQGFETYLETSPLMRDGGSKVYAPRVAEMLTPHVRQADPQSPLFLQMMLVDAHRPFNVDDAVKERFQSEGLPPAVGRYRAALNRMDDGVQQLIKRLERARPGLKQALWVIVGDHGEGLSHPEHHGTSHGTTLYPSVTHVPMGIWGPGIPKGQVNGLSAQIDLVPTILGLLDLAPNGELPGQDMSKLVRAGGGASTRDVVYTSTWFRWSQRAARFQGQQMCQIDFNKQGTRRQLSRAKPGSGLFAFPDGCFDLKTDPQQRTPLLDSTAEADLKAWFRRQSEANTAWGQPKAVHVPDGIDAQLKALGYAE